MIRNFVLATGLAFVLIPAQAQHAPDDGFQPMKQLSFFEGHWEGEGWMRQGPGEPQHFRGTETVESRLDGRVLVVEGVHRDAESDAVVHHAFATIFHDASNNVYRFRSHLADGRSGDYEATLEGGVFVWGFQAGPGRIRYTIRVEGDAWKEVGFFSMDGENWNPIFEMNLRRVRDADESQ